jgi:hypothetical protein
MATTTSHMSIPLEPLLTPLSHHHKRPPSTPLYLSPSPSLTLPLCSPSVQLLPPLVLDLSLHPPQPLTLPPCSENSVSTPPHPLHPMASALPTRPTKHLLFRSPLPKGEGVKQALAWNREQLVDLRRLWELRWQRRVSAGLLPMTQPPTMISDAVLAVGNSENIATVTLPSSRTHLLTSLQTPLDSLCRDPFRPMAWCDLTSVVHRPRCWQLASLTVLSKTTKIPLRFRQHTTTEKSSPSSSPRDLALPRPSLPKGWVYELEEVNAEVKAEVADPSQYLNLDAPLTRSKHKRADQLGDQYRRYRQASSITEAPLSFPSASKKTAMKCQRTTSALTSMPQIPL